MATNWIGKYDPDSGEYETDDECIVEFTSGQQAGYIPIPEFDTEKDDDV